MVMRSLLVSAVAIGGIVGLQAPAGAAAVMTIGSTSLFTIAPISGSFSDTTTFSLVPGASAFLTFSGSSSDVFSSLTAFFTTSTGATPTPITITGVGTNLISGMLMPRAGNLNTLVISGITPGTGAINGSLTVLSAAVPEASTWAMMTLGFGALGYSMRRRRATFDLA